MKKTKKNKKKMHGKTETERAISMEGDTKGSNPRLSDVVGIDKDCTKCRYWKRKNSRIKGEEIPGGTGKCVRPGGHCNPDVVNGKIGQSNDNNGIQLKPPTTQKKIRKNYKF